MSIPSLSPTPDSNVVEVIPQINTCESGTDLLEKKRKVAEKNEENVSVSMEVQNRLENNENSVTENSIKEPELKYNYSEDQWSPINPEGKKIYDRAFLLQLQGEPLCLQKPRNLPSSAEIVKEKAHLQKLPDDNRPASAPLRPRNYSDLVVPNFASRQSHPSRQGRDKPKKIITISNSFNENVKLQKCVNAWKPHVKKEIDDDDADKQKTQELEKKLRGILSKLTLQNLQTLVEQVKQLPINNGGRLMCVVNLIVEKAIDEPNFSVPCANMCKHIAKSKLNVNTGNQKSRNFFRKALLIKCNTEFQKDNKDEINYKNRLQLIENAETEEKKKQLREELEEEERKSRRRSLGNIKFTGELFKLHMFSATIMRKYLKILLLRGDEHSLECLCLLLTTIGKELETNKKKSKKSNTNKSSSLINSYIESIRNIVVRKTTSSRVGFMLQDVIELREELEKNLRGILNKLTPQNFQTLVKQVKQLPINNEEGLKCVVNLIFEKAIDEPNSGVPYAYMCKHIAMSKLNVNTGNQKSTNFRKALLTKCQAEFERDNNDEINYENRHQLIENAETEDEKKQLREELEEEERKSRHRSLGNIKFIGELFKICMLTASIMHECLKKLLLRGDEHSLECFCLLLTTIGKELETEKKSANTNKPSSLINSYFESMKEIVVRKMTSSTVRSMLQDVIELRENNWVPQREENNPKTIDQIHLEAHREALERQRLRHRTVFQKRSFEDRNMNRKGRGSANYQDDGWNMQSSKTKGTIDLSKLKLPKSVRETDLQLGHGFATLDQDSSGGNVKNTNQDSENKSTVLKNRFAAYGRESSRSSSTIPVPPLRKLSSKKRKQAIKVVEKKTKSLVDEFLCNPDFKEAILCVAETVNPTTAPVFISSAIFQVFDRCSKSRHLIGKLMHHLVKKEIITLDLYVKGLKSVLEMADDCAIDVPKIWQYLGELIEPMIQDNSISLAFLKDAAEPCKANGTAGKLMSELLHIVLKNEGSKRVAQLWKSSGLSWSDFLNENENITDFIKQNKLECTISKDDNQRQPLEKLSFDKIKEKLDTYLRKDVDNGVIFDWIDANIEEKDRDTEFVRALATSLVENSIEGEVSVSRFDRKKLLPRLPLLQKYLDLVICLELQVLYALQAIVNRLEHPKGLLINIFQFLDDQDIISYEAFIQWEQSTDPAEQEGKGMALKSVTSFMLWIREQEDDSIEEN
ncbi:eukaryotic translation initiation factor 4 gamma 1-like [Centruroides vittatus]|uniref:eukaryotic translation initiation factor 4 gamma 1-like n=1 Tax=Centruroides vittatus TaxID=120091 RepID=UPI00350EF993